MRYPASFTGALLAETLAPRQPRRALAVAETTLGAAKASRHRAVETELLRVEAAALLSLDADAAEAAANEGYALAQELGLGPEQAHGFGLLATSWPPGAIRPRPTSSTVLRAPNIEALV